MSAAFGSGDRVRVVSDELDGHFVGRVGVVVRRLPASDTFVVRLDGEADGALDPWFGPDDLQHVAGVSRCPRCAGTNGNHIEVHVRHGNGGGHNEPCPRSSAAADDVAGVSSQAGLQAWTPHARRDPGAHNLHVR